MKPFTLLMTVSLIAGLIACRRDIDSSKAELIVSAGEVMPGEIVTARVANPLPGTTYQWYEPDYLYAGETDDHSKTRFICTEEGLDSIKVTLCQNGRPYAHLSKAIRVSKERFHMPDPLPNGTLQSLSGMTLYADYFFMRDSTLAFLIKTHGKYNGLQSHILVRDTSFGKKIKASFTEVWQPAAVESGNMQAIMVLFTNTVYEPGLWPIEFTVRNQIHRGQLRVTVSDHQFKYEFILPSNNNLYINPQSLGVVYR